MNNIFFTADTHFNHSNIIEFCNRPFSDVLEMNEILIQNWNKVIKKEDLIYHLGDFGFGELKHILDRLNGGIVLLVGSHDKDTLMYSDRFVEIYDILEISPYDLKEEIFITLCHYAMRVWPKSHYNSWHLFGHSHNKLEPFGKSFDIGVDGHNFTPWSLDEIIEKMKKLPNNFNYVEYFY